MTGAPTPSGTTGPTGGPTGSPAADAPDQAAYTVCQPQVQGISVGWADVYDNTAEGQSIDITHLRDGDYVLRSTINPDCFVAEADYTNNTAHAYVTVRGTQVTWSPPT